MRTKSRRARDKEKHKDNGELPSTGDVWDAYLYDTYSRKKVTKIKGVYRCKTCGKEFRSLKDAQSHARGHKRIKTRTKIKS